MDYYSLTVREIKLNITLRELDCAVIAMHEMRKKLENDNSYKTVQAALSSMISKIKEQEEIFKKEIQEVEGANQDA